MSTLPAGIRHVIVLMLENRSFDHLLGNLPNVDGPRGRSNIDPLDGSRVPATFDATPTSPALPDPANKGQLTGDPVHDFVAVNRQLFEADDPAPGAPITCGGFIAAARQSKDPDANRIAREVMRCFDTPKQLTTMAALAADFVVCDHWYSSVPGPTWPNRLFVHAATSFGTLDDQLRFFEGTTIYDRLDEAGADWAIYYHDVPQSACLHELIDRRDRVGRRCMRPVSEFFKDVRAHRLADATRHTLPAYVFIEPGYTEPAHGFFGRLLDGLKWLGHLLGFPIQPSQSHANDQHPPHDVRLGEHLIADLYDALRANEDVWQHCLFIVLHDEHGGLYDHDPPPSATPPDGLRSATPPFGFDRAGLRVPAILVSPYLKTGTESTPYEHCSIVRTVREHFCPNATHLTDRDAAAPALRSALFTPTPRTDAPRRLARPTPVFAILRTGDAAGQPLNDLQTHLLSLAAAVAAAPVGAPGGPPGPTPRPPAAAPGARRPVGKVIDVTATPTPSIMTEADGHALAQRLMQRRGLR
jgi:phospholipase C